MELISFSEFHFDNENYNNFNFQSPNKVYSKAHSLE